MAVEIVVDRLRLDARRNRELRRDAVRGGAEMKFGAPQAIAQPVRACAIDREERLSVGEIEHGQREAPARELRGSRSHAGGRPPVPNMRGRGLPRFLRARRPPSAGCRPAPRRRRSRSPRRPVGTVRASRPHPLQRRISCRWRRAAPECAPGTRRAGGPRRRADALRRSNHKVPSSLTRERSDLWNCATVPSRRGDRPEKRRENGKAADDGELSQARVFGEPEHDAMQSRRETVLDERRITPSNARDPQST